MTVDQVSGERAKEPLLTLSGYRRRAKGYAGGIVFGAYLLPALAGVSQWVTRAADRFKWRVGRI